MLAQPHDPARQPHRPCDDAPANASPDGAQAAALPDGTPVGFRPIGPHDADRLARAFDQLSPTSRYRRFLSPIKSLSDQELRRLTHVDFVDHVAWVAELRCEPERPLAGVGRWVRSKTDPTLAEIALTIVDAYQRQGLGRALLVRLARSAVLLGVERFEARVLGENQPMRALLRTFGARQIDYDMGAYVLQLSVSSLLQTRSGAGVRS
jgi:RimJ/RimL family protein N-acetyltransferase